MTDSQNIKKTALFVGVTFLVSYLMVFLYLGLGGRWGSVSMAFVTILYMFVPMTVAIVLRKGIEREPVAETFGISFRLNKWFAAGWLFPVFLACAAFGVALLIPGVRFDPQMSEFFAKFVGQVPPEKLAAVRYSIAALPIPLFYVTLLAGMLAGATVNAIAAFGEELGWRGYLQQKLEFLGFWRMSAIIGVIWGLWHLPLVIHGYNYPQHPLLGVLMMTVFTTLLSPIISFIRIRSKSVIATSILHGTMNGVSGAAVLMIGGGNDLTVGVTGLAGFIVLLLIDIAIFVFARDLRQASA